MEGNDPLQCPVCRARFRGSSTCSRCGADLEPLMMLIAKAYQFRKLAAQALQAGNYDRAQWLAAQAQESCSTPRGAALARLSAWLLEQRVRPDSAAPLNESAAASRTSDRSVTPKVIAAVRDRQQAIWCLALAGLLGLGWAATARAVRWLRNCQR